MTCEASGTSRVKINVQSNGLPAKCFYAPDREMVEQNIEFSVDFNVNQSEHDTFVDVGLNSSLFNGYVCDWTMAMDMHVRDSLKFSKPVGTASLDKANGVAADGVLLHRAVTTSYQVDPFYPTNYTGADLL